MTLAKVREVRRAMNESHVFKLVSPEYSLQIFCYHMLGHSPLHIMETASAEITYARILHRSPMKKSNFRKGSQGRKYCDDLQHLISLLMNGTVPSEATPEFLAAVKPLARQLLEEWEIGDVRRMFS